MSYELVEPFDIDGDELRGLSPQTCFCLGAEFVTIRNKLLACPEPFIELCHEANAERISAMSHRNGRFCEIGPATDGWCRVHIGGQLV